MMSVMELYIITSLSLPKLHKVVTFFWISSLWNSLWLHPTTGGDVPPWFAEALRQALESIDKKIDKLSNDPDVNEKIDKFTNVTNDLNRKIDKLTNNMNDKIDKLTNNMNDKIDKLTNDVDDLKTDIQSLKKTQEHIKRLSAIVSRHVLLYYSYF